VCLAVDEGAQDGVSGRDHTLGPGLDGVHAAVGPVGDVGEGVGVGGEAGGGCHHVGDGLGLDLDQATAAEAVLGAVVEQDVGERLGGSGVADVGPDGEVWAG
jgi:hypothetical protein